MFYWQGFCSDYYKLWSRAMSEHIAESEEKVGTEGLETSLGADAFIDSLASAFVVKGAIHNQGLIGGIGLKVLKPDPLHSAVADRESKLILEKLVVTDVTQRVLFVLSFCS